VRLPPLTARPRLSAAVPSPACPPSLAHCPVDPTLRRQLLRPLALPPSFCFAGPVRQCRAVAPARPLFSLCAVGLLCQFHLPRARRGPARAHSCTSLGFLATTPAHAPNSLLIASPMPRAHPSPHFTHPRPLSRSALVFSAIQIAGDCSILPELRPEVRQPSPCLISLIAPCVRPISPSPVLGRGGPPCTRGGRPI
jgi:hypothetical protein